MTESFKPARVPFSPGTGVPLDVEKVVAQAEAFNTQAEAARQYDKCSHGLPANHYCQICNEKPEPNGKFFYDKGVRDAEARIVNWLRDPGGSGAAMKYAHRSLQTVSAFTDKVIDCNTPADVDQIADAIERGEHNA